MMRTEIQYGVRYFHSGVVTPLPDEFEACQLRDKLKNYQIPTEVVCRRVTCGAWIVPKVKLLNGG
jgi:hypothetical protein